MANVRSEACLFYANTGSDAIPVYTQLGSEEALTFTTTSKDIDLSDKSSTWDLATYGNRAWSISANGIHVENDAAFAALRALHLTTPATMKIKIKTIDGKMFTGSIILNTLTYDAPKAGVVRVSSIAMKGAGALTEAAAA